MRLMLIEYGVTLSYWDRVRVPKILPRAYLLKPPPAQAVGGSPQDRPSWPGPLMCAACGADLRRKNESAKVLKQSNVRFNESASAFRYLVSSARAEAQTSGVIYSNRAERTEGWCVWLLSARRR